MEWKLVRSTPGLGLLCMLAACGGNGAEAPPPQREAQTVTSEPPPAMLGPPSALDAAGGASASSAETFAALRREVGMLRSEVREMREQISRMPGAAQAAAAPPDPRVDPVAREEARQADRQRIASAEATFQAERRDARWSQDQATAIRSLLTQAGDGMSAQLRSVDCRSQSCRVELASSGAVGGLDVPMLLTRLNGGLSHVTAGQVEQGDGTQTTVLYLSR